MFLYTWPIKKMSNQRHVLDSAELDRGGGYSRFFFLRGSKSNQKFYRDKNRK